MHPKTIPPLRSLLGRLGAAGRAFWRCDGPSWAAAIAYYSLLSLIPLLLVLAAAAAVVVDPKWAVALATHYLGGYLPQGAAPVWQAATHALDAWRHRGWLFVLPLLWTGSLVFGALDRALNIAFDSAGRSGLLKRLAVRLAMLLTLGALFVVALLTQLALGAVVALRPQPADHWALGALALAAPALLLWLAFLLAYRLVPRQRPAWRLAAVGAGVATALLYFVRPLFLGYVARVASYGLVYGPLAGVVVAVLWSWIFAMVMLYGGQVASSLDDRTPGC